MDELNQFIKILNAECDKLKKLQQMQPHMKEPWRYYSPSLDQDIENDYQPLRAVINAGKFTIEAEKLVNAGKKNDAWKQLCLAQSALLKALSTNGKAKAKKIGNSLGGKADGEKTREAIFNIADDILSSDPIIASHPKWRGLTSKVANKLSEKGIDKTDNHIRRILKELKPILVNR